MSHPQSSSWTDAASPETAGASDRVRARSGAGRWFDNMRAWVRGRREAPFDGTPLNPTALAAVGAFGKHPAWPDFMPDLGLDYPALAEFKHRLFDAGIAPHVQAGTWAQWPAGDGLADFDHVLLFRPAGRLVRDGGHVAIQSRGLGCARIFPSRDGRDRTRYPLVLAAHAAFETVPAELSLVAGESLQADWCCRRVLTALGNVRDKIADASAADVAAVIEAASQQLARVATPELADLAADTRPDPADGERALAELNIEIGEVVPPSAGVSPARPTRAVLSVLYELGNRLGGYVQTASSEPAPERAAQLRLPGGRLTGTEAVALWSRFLLQELRHDVAMLLVAPTDPLAAPAVEPAADEAGVEEAAETWVDLILGPPDPATLLCLLATPRRVVPASHVPFRFDDSFLHRAGRRLDAARRMREVG